MDVALPCSPRSGRVKTLPYGNPRRAVRDAGPYGFGNGIVRLAVRLRPSGFRAAARAAPTDDRWFPA